MENCPFINMEKENHFCGASVTGMRLPAADVRTYCRTEDHHDCPMLLARTLRDGFGVLPF